jgi:hypothetical protein
MHVSVTTGCGPARDGLFEHRDLLRCEAWTGTTKSGIQLTLLVTWGTTGEVTHRMPNVVALSTAHAMLNVSRVPGPNVSGVARHSGTLPAQPAAPPRGNLAPSGASLGGRYAGITVLPHSELITSLIPKDTCVGQLTAILRIDGDVAATIAGYRATFERLWGPGFRPIRDRRDDWTLNGVQYEYTSYVVWKRPGRTYLLVDSCQNI